MTDISLFQGARDRLSTFAPSFGAHPQRPRANLKGHLFLSSIFYRRLIKKNDYLTAQLLLTVLDVDIFFVTRTRSTTVDPEIGNPPAIKHANSSHPHRTRAVSHPP